VQDGANGYMDLHAAEDVETRNSQYKKLVNAYYDLATVFYEWGWGPCFHFHYRFPFESFWEATRRHEYQLAAKLNVTREGHVLDVGCGIGGPMRNIARFLSCKVTGITLNPYQVDRGNEICQYDATVAEVTELVQGDFMDLPFEKNQFQAAYAIEATCHAPDRVKCYKQVYDVLEPGARFALYEWCMTDKYDPNNENHQFMKKKIEEGNGLPDITTCKECYKAMEAAGFEMVEAFDYADAYEAKGQAKPWMTPLMPSWNPISQRFQFNWLGSKITNASIYMMELLWIAPKGTIATQKYLQEGAFALRDAGTEKIFTTAYFMVGRKPLNEEVSK
jgi:sterol 24-C-methyltransferase